MVNAEQRFKEAARLHGFYFNEGDSAATNAEYGKVVAALRTLRTSPDRGQGFLLACLSDSDLSVVVWAAFYLLRDGEAEAVAALERVAQTDSSNVAHEAEMTLKEWRAGRLKVE